MGKRVVFTGGSGKAGRHVVPYLQQRGHQVLNLDRVPLDLPGVNTLIVDLADSPVLSRQIARAVALPFASASAFVTVQANLPEARILFTVAQDHHRCILRAIDPTGGTNPSNLVWYLRNANSGGAPDITAFPYGDKKWMPLAGDSNYPF